MEPGKLDAKAIIPDVPTAVYSFIKMDSPETYICVYGNFENIYWDDENYEENYEIKYKIEAILLLKTRIIILKIESKLFYLNDTRKERQ